MIPSIQRDGTDRRPVRSFYTRRVERILVTGGDRSQGIVERLDFERLDNESDDALEFAHRIIERRPTTVVHAAIESESLLGALARVAELKHLIVLSDLAVHGTGPRMPSVMSVDTMPTDTSNRTVRGLLRLENDAKAFSSERPEVVVTILRLAPILGDSGPLSRLLARPVIPAILGFDPRLQFLHVDDATQVVEHAVRHPHAGTFDITAPGQAYLSRVARLGRRAIRPLPEPLFRHLDLGLPAHLIDLMKHGRVVRPTSRSFGPTRSCRRTIMDFYGG